MSAGSWISKHNFLGLGSIEFKVVGVGPLFHMQDLGFACILIFGRDYVRFSMFGLSPLQQCFKRTSFTLYMVSVVTVKSGRAYASNK